MQQHKLIVLPVEKEHPVRKGAELPQTSVNVLHHRLSDSRSVLFQRSNVCKDFLAVDAIRFACFSPFLQIIEILDYFDLPFASR
jgi:hypothetical protein